MSQHTGARNLELRIKRFHPVSSSSRLQQMVAAGCSRCLTFTMMPILRNCSWNCWHQILPTMVSIITVETKWSQDVHHHQSPLGIRVHLSSDDTCWHQLIPFLHQMFPYSRPLVSTAVLIGISIRLIHQTLVSDNIYLLVSCICISYAFHMHFSWSMSSFLFPHIL